MKKTFTINISGTIFHIEDDAYEKLQGYLLKLKNHFGIDNEGREIVTDIENRIAELFTEKAKGESKVVVTEWVDEVIATMGTPEDFIEQERNEVPVTGTVKRKRRLYRDTDNRVMGGVCSGLGAYFNLDPVVIRIFFVILLLANGIGALAYLVLWIAVPKAQTTTQRLEMKGQEVNISNIERTIRDDVPEGKDGVQKPENKETVAKNKEKTTRGPNGGSDVVKDILKATVIAIGIFLILIGFFGLLGFISTMAIGQTFLSDWPLSWSPDFQISNMLNQFVSPGTLTWGLISIGLLIGIPLLAILFAGTKLVFRYKSNNTAIGLGMVGIWLIALLALVFISVHEVGNFKSNTSLTNTETIYPGTGKTLYLKQGEDKFSSFSVTNWNIDRFKVVQVDEKNVLLGEPRLDIEKSPTDDCVIVVKKWSRGKTQADANQNIQKIIYNYRVSDSTLTFDPWFLLGETGRWHDQKVNITLKLPEGMAVYLGDNMDRIIYDIDNVSDTWDHDMIGKTWVMKPEGLILKDSIR